MFNQLKDILCYFIYFLKKSVKYITHIIIIALIFGVYVYINNKFFNNELKIEFLIGILISVVAAIIFESYRGYKADKIDTLIKKGIYNELNRNLKKLIVEIMHSHKAIEYFVLVNISESKDNKLENPVTILDLTNDIFIHNTLNKIIDVFKGSDLIVNNSSSKIFNQPVENNYNRLYELSIDIYNDLCEQMGELLDNFFRYDYRTLIALREEECILKKLTDVYSNLLTIKIGFNKEGLMRGHPVFYFETYLNPFLILLSELMELLYKEDVLFKPKNKTKTTITSAENKLISKNI